MKLKTRDATCSSTDDKSAGPRFPCTMPRDHGGEYHEYRDEGTGRGDDRTFRWPAAPKVDSGPLSGLWVNRLRTYERRMVQFGGGSYDDWTEELRDFEKPVAESNLVSSRLRGSTDHLVLLDVDLGASLVPSRTPGHFHLLIDAPMSWWRYKRLLRALARAGVIEKSWARASIRSGATFVRLNDK